MNKKTKKQQQVFVIYKDKTLPNGGRAYYDCEWVQFRTDSTKELTLTTSVTLMYLNRYQQNYIN